MAPTASPYVRYHAGPEACRVDSVLPRTLRVLFPDRLSRARRSMGRAAALHEGGEFHEEEGVLHVILPLKGEESVPAGEALVNRLVRQCHAPVPLRAAARRLRVGTKALKALEGCGLAPSLQVPGFQHGRRYMLRAFSLSDMEALARHLAGGRSDA